MRFLYDFFLSLYILAIRVYSLFNAKARKWIDGRKNWVQHYKDTLEPGEKRIWIHCSSVGEYEQARPVIEALKLQYPRYETVVTFFSPSGYEAFRKTDAVDYVFYLPADTAGNASEFVGLVQPSLAIFAKYEFWYHYLRQLKRNSIPTLLISGAFRPNQVFFKWYGNLFRKMLHSFSFFFLQDKQSQALLEKLGFTNSIVSGDTRYDRVSIIAENFAPIPAIEKFKGGARMLIAGSTWPGDELVLKECLSVLPADWKLIIAPHEVDAGHVSKVQAMFGDEAVLHSQLTDIRTRTEKRILIINNIGMLSRLFAYGDIAFIGGGFQKDGIHNVLEPAVFGLPVIFGPFYEKFVEAKELASLRYVFPVNNVSECKVILEKLITDEPYRKSLSESIRKFMQEHRGATGAVMSKLVQEKWLG